MGRRIGQRYIRLDEGTTYAVDVRDDEDHGLEWIMRYGSAGAIEAVRFEVASILASYEALFSVSNVERNQRINEMKEALRRPWTRRPTQQPREMQRKGGG